MEVDIAERHRQEKKDLKAKLLSMKKGIDPSDKKRRKAINAEIEKLERDLKDRHDKEYGEMTNGIISDGIGKMRTTSEATTDSVGSQEEAPSFKYEVREVSRAQKKKDKKRQAQKEKQEEAESEDVSHLTKDRDAEKENLDRILKEKGLKIHEIPADGNCLYRAIEHQLLLKGIQTSVSDLRSKTADFMREHPDDFIPFIEFDDDDDNVDLQFKHYCEVLENSVVWGGNVELQAMSRVLGVAIDVVQGEGPVISFGTQDRGGDQKKLVLSYHRYACSMGEHYNSLVAVASS